MDDAPTTATTAHKGPTRGQQQTGRRKALLADLRAMVEVLGKQLDSLDLTVVDAHDPQESSRQVPRPGFVPMSRPRVDRVHVERQVVPKLQDARKLVKGALADAGYDWTEQR